MCSFCENFPLILNIIGLFCDIVGAFFIAYEVIRKFEGEMLADSNVDKDNIDQSRTVELTSYSGEPLQYAPDISKEYKKYSKDKEFNMKMGLIILVFGFAVQIVSNILQWKN